MHIKIIELPINRITVTFNFDTDKYCVEYLNSDSDALSDIPHDIVSIQNPFYSDRKSVV